MTFFVNLINQKQSYNRFKSASADCYLLLSSLLLLKLLLFSSILFFLNLFLVLMDALRLQGKCQDKNFGSSLIQIILKNLSEMPLK